ncbi:methyltransferase [Noviherbaspirillum sp. 1P10PC]|uniref:methyltransferase family protein n=1 Tax=Noviherbaspirillum sp. 1P10PC TaxID=3132292 RepID=UPI0039A28811
MNRLSTMGSHPITQIAAAALLIPMWAWFGYRHIVAFSVTDEWSYLFLCISETLTVGFLLIRTYPKSVSKIPLDWIVAIVGTFSTLLFLPATWGILPSAKYAIALGTLLQIFGMISLNRSFAIVAAKREIKTKGMYRFVRHPLYASYLLTYSGYLLANTNFENLMIYLFAIGCMVLRIFREENHLSVDQGYAAYMRRVRYRIIPFLF